MDLSTNSGLQSTVLAVMDREGDAFLTAYMPVAVILATAKINRKLRVGDMETTVTGTSTNGILTLPEDFAGARRVEAQPYGPLEQVTPDYAASKYPTGAGAFPKYYTIQGNILTTYPFYSGEITLDYYARVPSLSEANPTNWALLTYPDVYFFLTLSEAYAAIKDGETALLWNQRGIVTIDEINEDDKKRRFSNMKARVKGPTP